MIVVLHNSVLSVSEITLSYLIHIIIACKSRITLFFLEKGISPARNVNWPVHGI